MPSFGEKLKQEREKRNFTLEQISVSTKIGTRLLQALEEDKFNQLPGGIFNKGFVRAYARFVGLDEDQTVADYLQASGDAPAVALETQAHESGARDHEERLRDLAASASIPLRQLPWGWFAAVLLVVALLLSLWNHRRQQHAKPSIRPVTPATLHPPANPSQVPAQAASSAKTAPALAARGTTPPPPYSSAAQEEFQVLIHARETSWISTNVDGQRMGAEVLDSGSERTLAARSRIILKLGNAGGVDLRFNGKKLGLEGEPGEVRTVTFGPRGILPKAPDIASIP